MFILIPLLEYRRRYVVSCSVLENCHIIHGIIKGKRESYLKSSLAYLFFLAV